MHRRLVLFFLIVIAAVGIVGCATKKAKEVSSPVRPVGPATDVRTVRIYHTGESVPSHRTIGSIKAVAPTGASRAELNGRLRQKAAALGADAVIDVRYSNEMASAAAGRLSCQKGQHECYHVGSNTIYRPKVSGTAVLLEPRQTGQGEE